MIKLIVRIMPYAVLCMSALLFLASVVTLDGTVESEPTMISINDLQNGEFPETEWWNVEDSYLGVPGIAYEYVETANGDQIGSRLYSLPMVSKATALSWADDVQNSRPVQYADCRLFVVLSEAEFKSAVPDLNLENLSELCIPFRFSGLRSDATRLPETFKEMISEESPGFEFGNRWVLKPGKPIQKDEATSMLFFAIAFFGGACAWIWRRCIVASKCQGIASPGSDSASIEGLQAGLVMGVRSGVATALQNSLESCKTPSADT